MTTFKIKISTAGGGTPFIKQVPGLRPVWGNCEFFINEEIDECDLWVVYGGLGKIEHVHCPVAATLLITNEPPSVKTYDKKFTDQFGAVQTCQNIKHPHIIHEQQALPWWVGHKMRPDGSDDVVQEKTYDELIHLPTPQKTKVLSIIVSNKRFTAGHRKRHDFAQFLKRELGDQIDIFGIDKPLEDKWDAIAPYKYHIVIENAVHDDYWTEKLTDAFLGESYPLYYGATNIAKYFSPDMLSVIDITKPEEALTILKSLIANDTYERSTTALRDAKGLVLNTYQMFPMLASYANTLPSTAEKTLCTLAPESQSGIVISIKRCIKALLRIIHAR